MSLLLVQAREGRKWRWWLGGMACRWKNKMVQQITTWRTRRLSLAEQRRSMKKPTIYC